MGVQLEGDIENRGRFCSASGHLNVIMKGKELWDLELGRDIIKVTSLEQGETREEAGPYLAWRAARAGQGLRALSTVLCGNEGKKGVKNGSSAVLGDTNVTET